MILADTRFVVVTPHDEFPAFACVSLSLGLQDLAFEGDATRLLVRHLSTGAVRGRAASASLRAVGSRTT